LSIDTPGIYADIPEDEYHADPCEEPSLSRSVIKMLISKSPAHIAHCHPKLNPNPQPEKSESKFDLGTACHALLLEGEDKAEIIDAADWRTAKAKESRDEARANGKIPFLPHQWQDAIAMVKSAERQITECEDLKGVDLLTDGKAEQTLIWREESGIWCRVRPDWWSNDQVVMLDYKTTDMSANPEDFHRNVISMGYDIQDQFYTRGAYNLTGKEPKFIFVVQETYAPFLCSFICLQPDFREIGFRKMELGMDIWERCIKSKKWEGYPKRACHISAPTWELAKWGEV
jgi:hypothetical protein